jgi:uncharacterized protein (DUF2384 family)
MPWRCHVPDLIQDDERLRDADVLIEEFIERVTQDLERLREEGAEFDPDFAERFRETARRLSKRLNEELPPELDPDAVAEIRGIIVEGLHGLDDLDPERPWDTVEYFVLKAEAMRHIVRDALDGHVGSNSQDAQALVRTLREWLPRVPQVQLAKLANISPRQFHRWRKEGGEPSRRLVVVVRLVALLHRAWTPEGVVAWFYRPRRELDGKRPFDVLDDPDYEGRLLTSVRQGRAQHGS